MTADPVPAEPWETATSPGYWMHEASGVLRPAVIAYLEGEALTREQVTLLRGYFCQWIDAPCWTGPMLGTLRASARVLWTRDDIERWLHRAAVHGMDPL